jgi:hypothetical protein
MFWSELQMYLHYLTKHLIVLPIDHRYTHSEMKRMLNVLNTIL